MILKNSSYKELENRIKNNNFRVVIYGAGMIGRIVVPYIISKHDLNDYVECYVDRDSRKIGKKVTIGTKEIEIKNPDILINNCNPIIILITNSNYFPVIEYLDKLDSLKDSECYIVPIMQKLDQRENIPRIIHYCWFGGGEIPDYLKKCIDSWYRVCPDYEIIRWDENNYDVNKYLYTRQAYEKGKYGFVSDVARLDILYRNGGVYLDTDVELIKHLDSFLFNKGFVGVERWGNINSGGGIGAVPQHPMIREMLDYRLEFPFVYEDGTLNLETNGLYETIPFVRHGMRIDNTLQIVNDMTVYPASVFHPYDYMSCEERIEADTVSIHRFYGGWMEPKDKQTRANTQDAYKAVLDRMSKSTYTNS